MSERSDIDLANLATMPQYLHGYFNRLSTIDNASTDETTRPFNVFLVSENPEI